MKICCKCKIEKEYIEFSISNSTKDGYNFHCKVCNKIYRLNNIDKIRERHKIYRLNNIDKIREKQKEWRLANKNKIIEMKKQEYINNRDKIIKRSRQRRIDKPNYNKEYSKLYCQTKHGKLVKNVLEHRRRDLLKANTVGEHHTTKDIMNKFKLQYGLCMYCKTSIKGGYHIDHIIPPCDGGGNEAWNIQLLCKKCNLSKSDNPATEFAQKHGMLV